MARTMGQGMVNLPRQGVNSLLMELAVDRSSRADILLNRPEAGDRPGPYLPGHQQLLKTYH